MQDVYQVTAVANWIPKIRAVVVFFLRAEMAKVVLNEKQKLLLLPNQQLIIDVKTRWNTL